MDNKYFNIYNNLPWFFCKIVRFKIFDWKNIKYILQNENLISKNFLYIVDNKLSGI